MLGPVALVLSGQYRATIVGVHFDLVVEHLRFPDLVGLEGFRDKAIGVAIRCLHLDLTRGQRLDEVVDQLGLRPQGSVVILPTPPPGAVSTHGLGERIGRRDSRVGIPGGADEQDAAGSLPDQLLKSFWIAEGERSVGGGALVLPKGYRRDRVRRTRLPLCTLFNW